MHQPVWGSNYLPSHAQHDRVYENYVNGVDPNQHDLSSMMIAPPVDQEQDAFGAMQSHTTALAGVGSHLYLP